MASRNVKLGTTAAVVLALAGGIGALFSDKKTQPPPAAPAVVAEIAEIADVTSDTVLDRLFQQANSNLQVLVQQIKSGEGQVDTAALHRTIADLDARLKLEMGKPTGGDPRARSRLVRELVDVQTRLHALDTDAEFLVSYARMHQDKLRNMQRLYRGNSNIVSFCSAMTGYLSNQLRAPPARHADWPTILITLHGDTIEGLIAMADAQASPTTPQDKAALIQIRDRNPEVMARVPALRRLIDKHTR